MPTAPSVAPRTGARVLLFDNTDRVLLIHAKDPHHPSNHWWELPGGGLDDGEDFIKAARREVAEESGILLLEIGRKLWIRESRFHYKGRDHHRIDHVFLARTTSKAPQVPVRPTENEKAGLIERRWWSASELRHCQDPVLPRNLADLLDSILGGCMPDDPLYLIDQPH